MQPRSVRELPATYREIYHLRVTEGYKLLILNLIALPLLVAACGVLIGWLVLYAAIGAPLVIAALPLGTSWAVGLLIFFAVLPLHEWIHGLAMQFYGHSPRYGIKPLKGVLYATADGAYFWRNQYVVVLLAPLVVISLIAFAMSLLFEPGSMGWVMLAAASNVTGAVGDLWMTQQTLRFPPDALIRDEEDGMRVFYHA